MGLVIENPEQDQDEELDKDTDETAVRHVCGAESRVESFETSIAVGGCTVDGSKSELTAEPELQGSHGRSGEVERQARFRDA